MELSEDTIAYLGPCRACEGYHGSWEPCLSKDELVQQDITFLLQALGLGDHARPYSTHEVIKREIIPHCIRLAAWRHK